MATAAEGLSIFTSAFTNFELAAGLAPVLLLGFTAIAVVAITRNSREVKVLLFPLYVFFAWCGWDIYIGNSNWIGTSVIATILALVWVFSTLQVNTFSNIIGTNSVFRKPWTETGKLAKNARIHALTNKLQRDANRKIRGEELRELGHKINDQKILNDRRDYNQKTDNLLNKLNAMKHKDLNEGVLKGEVSRGGSSTFGNMPRVWTKILKAPGEKLRITDQNSVKYAGASLNLGKKAFKVKITKGKVWK